MHALTYIPAKRIAFYNIAARRSPSRPLGDRRPFYKNTKLWNLVKSLQSKGEAPLLEERRLLFVLLPMTLLPLVMLLSLL